MGHQLRTAEPGRERACEVYAWLRAIERAQLSEWRDDLRLASGLVHDLEDDLVKFDQKYAPFPNAAANEDEFRPERIKEIDRKLRAPLQAAAADVREARLEVVAGSEHEQWMEMLLWTAEPEFTVGKLPIPELDRLGAVLFHMADTFWTWELFALSELRGDERSDKDGRPRSAAARFMAGWCRENSESMTDTARLVIALGIEQPNVGDTGADPVKRLTDRWRKK